MVVVEKDSFCACLLMAVLSKQTQGSCLIYTATGDTAAVLIGAEDGTSSQSMPSPVPRGSSYGRSRKGPFVRKPSDIGEAVS